ncbi:protein MpOXR3 [Marchantia polymorpha subsp. ruderalis]|uniref:Oxidation resistance protein 1 n=3 Tax=Marchantia polymorpha TaxID=3197 RepID=A0AAF6BM21_MARPO|nr:hypothetical protein MARPO_0104s0023 [Marchantia polymorpha]PTQ31991.1 hypothetical protein MARPO_0104s0023 [Marchantia polymorpha]BBN13055.1 hypothetical protein Mp_6g00430 [Marchantia polymorpha subsp. ruderalis]BBN13056.1 hypothetical protein Mp_6g00430 [Marchantia polymorpha subsp. ruderalis]|eukprot:PTQ31988.1 hypothetical protein MARPO_0104s0023 [Marchantia polymorpha]
MQFGSDGMHTAYRESDSQYWDGEDKGWWWKMGSSFWMCWRRIGRGDSLGKPLLDEARTMCVGKYKRKTTTPTPPQTKESKDDFRGPDTSSLTAFLLSLLSCTESSSKYKNDQSNEETTGSDEQESATSSQNRAVRSRREGDNKIVTTVDPQSGEELLEGVNEKDGKGDTPTPVGDDPDAEWQLVSETDVAVSKSAQDAAGQLSAPESPSKHVILPDMSEESSLIPETLRTVVYSALPTLALGRQWVLLYSTIKHGISLRTLYRKAAIIPGPCLLIAGDRLGAVFGGLLSSPLKPTLKQKYQGTNESFVFTNVAGEPKVYRSTGSNRYYVLCTDDAIAFGGGGHFALYLDAELLNGTSANCETFGNPCLATTEDFVLKDVELWGFAHTSRYTPKYATFKEPEETPGISAW